MKIEPTLAQTYKNQDITGWWASVKLDGVRAVWDGEKFYTRKGHVIHTPDWFTEGMPDVPLDGELYISCDNFDEISGLVRMTDPRAFGEEWDLMWSWVTYRVFDLYGGEGSFTSRYDGVLGLIRPSHVKIVHQLPINDVDYMLNDAVSKGYEGIMLRDPTAPYHHKRTSTLLKYKKTQDMDGTVVGYEDGKGRNEGRVGALWVESDGSKYKVGTGLTDEVRTNPPPIGSIITVEYFEITKAGKPRFPVYKGMRAEQ